MVSPNILSGYTKFQKQYFIYHFSWFSFNDKHLSGSTKWIFLLGLIGPMIYKWRIVNISSWL